MHNINSGRLSRYVYILCMAVMCYASFFFYPRWKNNGTEAAISWDVSGYYWYLPSIFIYKDLKHQSFKDSVLNKYRPTNLDFQQGVQLDNGNYVMKYASGMAVMYSPFFMAAHILARPLGFPADGFSRPYQFAIQFGGLLVSLIGLWYLRKLLLQFYSDKVVATVLVLLVLGSNYLNYSSIECGMSHCWLFTVYVFLILNTINFHKTFQRKYAVRIGLLVGIATLTRPTDVISGLIPLLWGMESLSPSAIAQQARLIFKNVRSLLLAALCAAAVISIQLIYWKYVSGHWLVYSYQNQHLYFKSPNFENYTFSYRSGWLTYSPMMILAFIGIIPFFVNGKNRVAILTFFLLDYYIVCSWNIWWYGGRAMVQSYPVLCFTIAALFDVAYRRKLLLALLAPVALVFLYYNAWVTYVFHKGDIWDDYNVPEAYFWRVAGRWNVPATTTLLKENPDMFEGVPRDLKLVYENNFIHDTGAFFLAHTGDSAKSLHLDAIHQNSPHFNFPFTNTGTTWMRVQGVFHCQSKEWDASKMTQFIVRLVNDTGIVKERMERVQRVLSDGQTRKVDLDIKLPQQSYNSVSILFWNADSDKPIWIDSLKVWVFNE